MKYLDEAVEILNFIEKYPEESKRVGFISSILEHIVDKTIVVTDKIIHDRAMTYIKDKCLDEHYWTARRLADEMFDNTMRDLADVRLADLIATYRNI